MPTFRYGGKLISLEKSSLLVGLKMRKGTSLQRSRGLEAPAPSSRLGGFQLIPVVQERGLGQADSESFLDELRNEEDVLVGTHVYQPDNDASLPMVPTGELYLVFRPWASPEDQQAIIDRFSLSIIQKRGKNGYILRLGPDSPNPISCVVALQAEALVAIAEPDLAMPLEFSMTLPDDPFFKFQWHLKNDGTDFRDSPAGVYNEARAGADARVVEAWQALGNMGSPAIVMAIVDNGFDLDHPDFDGRGRLVQPWDFVNNSPEPDRDPDDTHGTLCAGVALAGTNGKGIVGVAPNSRFMPVRNKELSDTMIELIFERVMSLGADVVSCSWGRPGLSVDGESMIDIPLSTRQREAVVRAATKGRGGRGCVILFAAGNSNRRLSDFCRLPEIIAVGASTSMDERADYSNFGPELSVLGPSGGRTPVISTFVSDGGPERTEVSAVVTRQSGEDLGFAGIPGDYKGFAGTSCSCPVVAGVCALVLSANPELSSVEVKEILEKTADKIGEGYGADGQSDLMGHGRVNALRAVQEAIKRRRTPARPPINDPLRIGTELQGRLYHEQDFQIFHINLDKSLTIQVEPGEGTDAVFELDLKRGARPEHLDDHDPRQRFEEDGKANTLSLKKIRDDDYFLIVRSAKGAGDFKLKITLS
ncbi:MAG: S8 family serine peptidase [Bacteroidia bacterium]